MDQNSSPNPPIYPLTKIVSNEKHKITNPVINLSKEPGWRIPASSNRSKTVELNDIISEPPSADTDTDNVSGTLVRQQQSNTSISSHGSLKEFIKGSSGRVQHRAPIKFKPSAELTKEAMEVSECLAKMSVRPPSLTSLRSSKTHKSDIKYKLMMKKSVSLKRNVPVCPLDLTGGYRLTSLDHIKMIKVDADDEDDDDEDEQQQTQTHKESIEGGTNEKSSSKSRKRIRNKDRGQSDKRHPKTLPSDHSKTVGNDNHQN
ncbi:hypothetical protein RDWZM_007360 [Blomia tropicalis]|uniref:Uncharacterized protein n=1 Tax=Blomia tropicalis TaxID=40697 RepID=A0A9Q0RHY4_BLOTA|nr:hypothetical protein RDWZM_007360 [Blomia tropicalis]